MQIPRLYFTLYCHFLGFDKKLCSENSEEIPYNEIRIFGLEHVLEL